MSAADLIQDLLVANGESLPVQSLCRAGVLVGMQDATIRVALNRLVSQGKVIHASRGHYSMNKNGATLSRAIDDWQSRDSVMTHWEGEWIGVHDSGVQRSDKTAWRHHLLALNLLGFRQLMPSLHIRPDNLSGSVDGVRTQLNGLGLSPNAAVFGLNNMDFARFRTAKKLWDSEERPLHYRQLRQALAQSSREFRHGDLEFSVRESLLLGRTVIVWLLRDPLLPKEMSESADRASLTLEMQKYHQAASALWKKWLMPLE